MCVCADSSVHVARSTAAACAVRKYLCSTRKIPNSLTALSMQLEAQQQLVKYLNPLDKFVMRYIHKIVNSVCACTALCMQLETLLCPKIISAWLGTSVRIYMYVCVPVYVYLCVHLSCFPS